MALRVRGAGKPPRIRKPTKEQMEEKWKSTNPRDLAYEIATFMGGDQSSWRGHSKANWAVGGNVHLVGTPEQIVEWFAKLKRAGCDGMQVNFYDFLPDLNFFGKRVMPLLREAGLRIDVA